MSDIILTPEQIIEQFQQSLEEQLQASKVIQRHEGLKRVPSIQIWLTIEKTALHAAVQQLCSIHYPHLAVISGCDLGEGIELLYHFFIYYGVVRGEYNVTLRMTLSKKDLTIDTITDFIPGALTSEREKQEFFGITVNNIPDSRRMFLPDDFPEGVYPWRKDETGIQEDMVKKLHEVGKTEGAKRREENKQ
jgi:membrane-bound hydrogenase subunit beta